MPLLNLKTCAKNVFKKYFIKIKCLKGRKMLRVKEGRLDCAAKQFAAYSRDSINSYRPFVILFYHVMNLKCYSVRLTVSEHQTRQTRHYKTI